MPHFRKSIFCLILFVSLAGPVRAAVGNEITCSHTTVDRDGKKIIKDIPLEKMVRRIGSDYYGIVQTKNFKIAIRYEGSIGDFFVADMRVGTVVQTHMGFDNGVARIEINYDPIKENPKLFPNPSETSTHVIYCKKPKSDCSREGSWVDSCEGEKH